MDLPGFFAGPSQPPSAAVDEESGTNASDPFHNGELQSAPANSSVVNNSGSVSSLPSFMTFSQPINYQSPYATGAPQRPFDITSTPFSKETSEVIARVKAKGVSGLTHGSTEWETAKQAVRAEMDLKDTNGIPSAANPTAARTGGRRGRGPRRRGSPAARDSITLAAPSLQGLVPIAPATPAAAALPVKPTVTPTSTPTSTRGRGRGRGSRARTIRGGRGSMRGSKRKRDKSEHDGDVSSSSEEITALPSQSRSGRKIFQATNPTPIIKTKVDEEAQPSPLSLMNPQTQTSARAAGKRKAVPKRTPGPSSVCKNCGRGHSPSSNAIVFCDGCNTPWHQYCHDPPIKKDYLLIADKEWFCADCVILREEKGRLQGKVPGDGMSLAEVSVYQGGANNLILTMISRNANTSKHSLTIHSSRSSSMPAPCIPRYQYTQPRRTSLSHQPMEPQTERLYKQKKSTTQKMSCHIPRPAMVSNCLLRAKMLGFL